MDAINSVVNTVNGLLFHEVVIYILLFTGLVFTIWTAFGQWRAVTHGFAVVRGKYDESQDPGAINHFQALSTALSATVGLGNIAGVAVAVALGGPGAVFWMWVIGVLGMALKMTEVTQSMLYRNTADPDNPHGGPMFVAKYGFARWGLPGVGTTIGGLFVVTLIISAITGGNMFQAWNVANTTRDYFGMSQLWSGLILAVIVGTVIIGGIKVIGRVASFIVPFMCVIYLIAALWVLGNNLGGVPEMLALIFRSGIGLNGGAEAQGAFLGGTVGFAMLWGIKRALFSSEAGQGSAPIAHSAAKTDEPVREGIVAGLEPLIDTLVVCTLTALVILSSGAWIRGPEATFASAQDISIVPVSGQTNTYTVETDGLPPKSDEARRIGRLGQGQDDWRDKETIFVRVAADENTEQGTNLAKITGRVAKSADGAITVSWGTITSTVPPTLAERDGTTDLGVYGDYAGSSLTGHAFDRVTPGLGKWLISLAVWLFAISTMISWSYYGEQGIVYLFGENRIAILSYKFIYCVLIIITCIPGLITTDAQLDMWTTLGLGVMLVVNIPLMWIFSVQAMRSYHDYFRRLKQGPMHDEIRDDGTTREQDAPAS